MCADKNEKETVSLKSFYFEFSSTYVCQISRKSKLKSESGDETKIAKIEEPSTSPAASCSSSPDSPPVEESPVKVEREDSDCWYQLEDGGEIKDLLPAGVIKNSSKMRFDVKEISLSEDL